MCISVKIQTYMNKIQTFPIIQINNSVEVGAALVEVLYMLTEYVLLDWLIDLVFQICTNTCAYTFRYSVDDGMLQIMNVNLSDQGQYRCTARTSLDEDDATALLTILG